MIETGLHIYELVTWKSAWINGIERFWSNSYHFASMTEWSEGEAAFTAHSISNAEQFLYPQNVHLFGRLMWEWTLRDGWRGMENLYVWPVSSFGQRQPIDGGLMLPFEWALMFKKDAAYGKSGRQAHRYTLAETEVVPYRGDGFTIKHAEPFGAHLTQLILYWFNNTHLEQAIFTREDELSFPTETRPVERISIGSVMKLGSIEDAQGRKTNRAKTYREIWEKSLPGHFLNNQEANRLALLHPDGLHKDDVPLLEAMANEMKGTFVNLLDYWTEGVKPEPMPTWRPTAGLDPLSMAVERICGDAVGECDAFAQIISNIQGYPGDYVPFDFVKPFIQLYGAMILRLDRMGVMRWTGTPIPIAVPVV